MLLNGYSKKGVVLSEGDFGEEVEVSDSWESHIATACLPRLKVNIGCRDITNSFDECSDLDNAQGWRLFNAIGQRLNNFGSIFHDATIFLVPSHRLFMWPVSSIGQKTVLNHMPSYAGSASFSFRTPLTCAFFVARRTREAH